MTLKISPRAMRYMAFATYAVLAVGVLAVMVVKLFLSAWSISDSFTRKVQDHWGSLSNDYSYSITGRPANFAVDGSAGTIIVPTANTSYEAYLSGVSTRDMDISFRVKVDKLALGGSEMVYLMARRTADNTQYLGRLRFAPDGSIRLQVVSEIQRNATLLGNEKEVPGVTHQADTFVWVRGQVVGAHPTTIRLKAWADGSSEPGNWRLSVSDSTASLQAPGGLGLRATLSPKVANAPVRFTFDDLHVSSLDFGVMASGYGGAQRTSYLR